MHNISIYVSYHDKCDLIKTSYFKPIQVGTALNEPYYENELNDAIANNISAKNQSFCELTAQYWAWKNDQDSDYIGFYHYRRHFILNINNHQESDEYGVVNYPHINETYCDDIGYSDLALARFLKNIDVVVPEKWDVRNVNAKNNLDQYEQGKNLNISDYHACLSILNQKYPEYMDAAERYNQSHYGYYTNMFIMKRHIFLQYCQWLFDILFTLEKQIDLSERNVQEYRVFGYLAEWLLGIYITKLQENKNLNIVPCRRTFIHSTNTGRYSLSSSQNFAPTQTNQKLIQELEKQYQQIVPIVTAFNENYAISGAALLQSIIENSRRNYFYDLYIIEGALSDITKFNFKLLLKKHSNFRLTFINGDRFFENKSLELHDHFTKETYYRVLIPKLLPFYNKVIYLDADLIVNNDIQQLFAIDIGDHYIGAVKDYVMRGFIKNEIICRAEGDYYTAKDYLTQYLQLKYPYDYVQAGVLILNTQQIRKFNIDDFIMQDISKRYYWFLDQDLLNKHCEGHIYFIDMKWNVLHGNGNVDSFFKKLPLPIMQEYFTARQDPWIIHFAGDKKPWTHPDIDFAQVFFFYLRNTPWINFSLKYQKNFTSPFKSIRNFDVRSLLRPVINKILPLGTNRRKRAYKFYIKIKKYL
ncbi:DUF4422 domain-containing protein [Commensalibacter oyaizuii]|uniref:DUF4422 domain-containing protein n=1 Tax=Commensalibacter oyaizuii TaxID=3043873 RepID=A0ABT6Q327_9PROT|nr:DUF4422 domain-containing protein [Commensalibacter sp. TBRC 16381]MDI2091534.1 DUF4422 domain-containing protein [Commensalibacter sp. TBRC 16381]